MLGSNPGVPLHVLGLEHRCATALITFCCLAWVGRPTLTRSTSWRGLHRPAQGGRRQLKQRNAEMCYWDSNKSRQDKGTTAAGQARLDCLCPPVPGRAFAPRQETQTQTQTQTDRDRQTGRDRQTDRQTDRQAGRQTDKQINNRFKPGVVFRCFRSEPVVEFALATHGDDTKVSCEGDSCTSPCTPSKVSSKIARRLACGIGGTATPPRQLTPGRGEAHVGSDGA